MKINDLAIVINNFDKSRKFIEIISETNDFFISNEKHKINKETFKIANTCLYATKASNYEISSFYSELTNLKELTNKPCIDALDLIQRIGQEELCEEGRNYYYVALNLINDYLIRNDFEQEFIVEQYSKKVIVNFNNGDVKYIDFPNNFLINKYAYI